MFLLIASSALAQNISIIKGEPPYHTDIHAPSPLHLTPDKSELIRLSRKTASIIIGNPTHFNVLAENSNTLVIVPRTPGASHFTVLDEKGEIIIQRHVIIASPKRDYMRIRRTCTQGDESCQSTSVYYCPGMCHEIAMNHQDGQVNNSETEQAASSTSDPTYTPPVPKADSP